MQESRGADSSMRPRLEGGMQWCPKDLGCVVQDLYEPPTEQSHSAALSQQGTSFSDHMANAAGVQRLHRHRCGLRCEHLWFVLAPYEAFTALHMS